MIRGATAGAWCQVVVVCASLSSVIGGGQTFRVDEAEANITAGQYSKALATILPAAKAGDPAGQFLLAALYLNGNGVSRDVAEALRWLTRSAEQGYGRAQSDLGAIYLEGRHVPRDIKVATVWLLKASRQGDPGGIYNVGLTYRDGLGVPRDLAKARSLFLESAEKGYALAQYGVARLYYDEQNFAQALKWYAKAGNQGDIEALYNLGYMYHTGQGTPRDYQRANELFLRVADRGRFDSSRRSAKALDMLGNAYRLGEGVRRDYVEAYKWYLLAAAQGHTKAPSQMKEIASSITPTQIAEARQRAKVFADGK